MFFHKIKKTFVFSLLLSILFANVLSVKAENVDLSEFDLGKFTLQKIIKTDDEKEIRNLVLKLNNCANRHNINGLKSVLSDTFVNNDGFDKNTYIEIVKKSWELYPNLKYSVEIKDLQIDDDIAQVTVADNAIGKIGNRKSEPDKIGNIKTTSESILFFQKFGNEWKIQSEFVIKEKTVLAYSDAQLLELNLTAPNQVSENTNYCAKLTVKHPEKLFTFASVNNEKITYPPVFSEEIFKTITSDGVLERMLEVNSDGKNEYIVATVGVTKPIITAENKVSIKITGMAIISARVNVINKKHPAAKI